MGPPPFSSNRVYLIRIEHVGNESSIADPELTGHDGEQTGLLAVHDESPFLTAWSAVYDEKAVCPASRGPWERGLQAPDE